MYTAAIVQSATVWQVVRSLRGLILYGTNHFYTQAAAVLRPTVAPMPAGMTHCCYNLYHAASVTEKALNEIGLKHAFANANDDSES